MALPDQSGGLDMRYGVKYMENPEDYPEAWAAMEYELRLRYEDYGLHGYPREDANALMHVLLRFGWRPAAPDERQAKP